jgi:hypothetical protein
VTPDQPYELEQVNASQARRSLRNGFITLVLAGALVIGLLLAVPGLKGVATTLSHMKAQWVVVAVALEAASCTSYVVAFLQVFDRPRCASGPELRSARRHSGRRSRWGARAASRSARG